MNRHVKAATGVAAVWLLQWGAFAGLVAGMRLLTAEALASLPDVLAEVLPLLALMGLPLSAYVCGKLLLGLSRTIDVPVLRYLHPALPMLMWMERGDPGDSLPYVVLITAAGFIPAIAALGKSPDA